MRNVILQAMGLERHVDVALGQQFDFENRDCFVLCSDGLTGKVTDDEILALILSSTKLDAACSDLIALAKQRGGDDNITVILAGVGGTCSRSSRASGSPTRSNRLKLPSGAPARARRSRRPLAAGTRDVSHGASPNVDESKDSPRLATPHLA